MARGASSSSGPRTGNKRSANTSTSPAAKRGKTSEKGQKTLEETIDGVEDDNEVAAQINDKSPAEHTADALQAREEAVKKREDAVTKKENDGQIGNSEGKAKAETKEGEKNAFDEVKADENEVQAAAEEEQDSKTVRT